MRSTVMLLLVLSLAAPAVAVSPSRLPQGNALTAAAVTPAEPLQITPDTRPVAEKLVPRLQRELAARQASEVLPVVVTLVEPKVSRSLSAGQAGYDATRAAQIEVLEQGFVSDVAAVGFTARRGLVNSPVVIGSIPAGAVARLAALPTVRAVEYDFPLKATRAQGGPLIGSDLLQAAGGGGDGIGIAILDTGIDGTHPELPWDTKITAWGDYTGTQTGDDIGSDDNGHGTACAGIAAGLGGGMAPEAHLWTLKVLDSEGAGPFSNTVSALDDVYTNRNSYGGVRVVSLSLGGADRFDYVCDNDGVAMTQAMAQLIDAGIAIFVAAGNEGCSDGVAFPACISHAIAVGAVYDADVGGWSFGEGTCMPSGCTDATSQADKITCYSNSGSQLDVLAPADCATTTAMGGGYESCFNGTSASTPYAAGAAAQIFSLRPQTTPAELRTALTSTGSAVTDGRNGITRRRINAMEAYQWLANGGSGGGPATYFVPAMIRAPGAFGSDWYSDVGVLNAGSATAAVTFTLYIGGQTLTASDQVPAGNQYLYANIVGQFGTTGGGLLRVASDNELVVNSRIYSKETAGTKGQFMDSYQSSDTLGTGESALLGGLVENASFRTNIGFGNTGATAATVTVTLYRWDGVAFGSYSFAVPANGWAQDNAPFANRFGQTNTTGWAQVTVASGSGVVAYASVVDKTTNDPTTIPMKR